MFPKPGKVPAIERDLKLLKKVWDESKQNVAVYEMSASGAPQFLVVTRYTQGLKEREPDFRKPMKERYNAVNGAGAFDKFMSSITENVEHQWAELMFFNPELSSK